MLEQRVAAVPRPGRRLRRRRLPRPRRATRGGSSRTTASRTRRCSTAPGSIADRYGVTARAGDVLHRPPGPARRRAHRRHRRRPEGRVPQRGRRRRSARDPARRRRCSPAALALAGPAARVRAARARRSHALEGQIMCPTCHTTLDQSDSRGGAPDRASSSSSGSTRARRSRRSRPSSSTNFGAGILAAPPHKGFDLLAWWLPLGGVIARRARCSPSASGAGAARAAPTSRPPAVRPRRRDRAAARRAAGTIGLMGTRLADRVSRGIRVGDHAVRAAARPGLPLGALERRGGPARRARHARRVVAREPPVHPRLHGRLRRARRGRRGDRQRRVGERADRDRGLRARRARARVRRAAAGAGADPRAGAARRRTPPRLGRAPRRRVRRVRRAVHRHGARRGARARERHGHGAEGRGAPRRVRARARRSRSSSRASRSRARCRRSAGCATATR